MGVAHVLLHVGHTHFRVRNYHDDSNYGYSALTVCLTICLAIGVAFFPAS